MSNKTSPQTSSNLTTSAADAPMMEAVNLAIRPLPMTRKGHNVLQNGQVELEVFVIDRLYLTSHDAWGHETTTSDVNRTLLCRFTGSPRNDDGNELDWTQASQVGNEVESMIKITNAAVTSTCSSDMLQLHFSAAVQDALAQRRSIAVPRKVVRWHRQLQARARIVTANKGATSVAAHDDESLNTRKWYGALSKTKRMLQNAATTIFHEDAWFYSPSTTSSFTRQRGRHHITSPSSTTIRARVFVEPPPCYAHESRPPPYEDVTSDSSTSS